MFKRYDVVIFLLLVIIVALGWGLYSYGPFSQAPTPGPTTTPPVVINRPITDTQDRIMIESLRENQLIASPLTVTGKARGNWYFEASFPVALLDGNGKQIAITPAQAQGEWMTTEYVPFSVTLTFTAPSTPMGTLVFQKDNPSGLPEFDAEVAVPIRFR